MDPQQELFTRLKLSIEALGYAVYDGFLPPENTPYPFVYLGDFRQTDTEYKNAVTGTVHPMIHIWHNNPGQRGTVSGMALKIKRICRAIQNTGNYKWFSKNYTHRMFPDYTTKTPLLHCVIEADFLFS